MNLAFKELNVLEDLYTQERPSDINLKNLAKMLGVKDNEVALAMGLNPQQMSKVPYAPQSIALKEWLGIFNLIIEIIYSAEKNINPTDVKVKMTKWLKLPRPEFNNDTPIDLMLKGKSRRVVNYLEQLQED